VDLIMKIFYLNRTEDESGVSGTGRVAQGFIFDNGKVAVTWLSDHPTVTVYCFGNRKSSTRIYFR